MFSNPLIPVDMMHYLLIDWLIAKHLFSCILFLIYARANYKIMFILSLNVFGISTYFELEYHECIFLYLWCFNFVQNIFPWNYWYRYTFHLVAQVFTSFYISRKVSVKRQSKDVILYTNYYIRNKYNYRSFRGTRTFLCHCELKKKVH